MANRSASESKNRSPSSQLLNQSGQDGQDGQDSMWDGDQAMDEQDHPWAFGQSPFLKASASSKHRSTHHPHPTPATPPATGRGVGGGEGGEEEEEEGGLVGHCREPNTVSIGSMTTAASEDGRSSLRRSAEINLSAMASTTAASRDALERRQVEKRTEPPDGFTVRTQRPTRVGLPCQWRVPDAGVVPGQY